MDTALSHEMHRLMYICRLFAGLLYRGICSTYPCGTRTQAKRWTVSGLLLIRRRTSSSSASLWPSPNRASKHRLLLLIFVETKRVISKQKCELMASLIVFFVSVSVRCFDNVYVGTNRAERNGLAKLHFTHQIAARYSQICFFLTTQINAHLLFFSCHLFFLVLPFI